MTTLRKVQKGYNEVLLLGIRQLPGPLRRMGQGYDMTDNQMILLSITLTLAERIRGVGLIQTGGFSVQKIFLSFLALEARMTIMLSTY